MQNEGSMAMGFVSSFWCVHAMDVCEISLNSGFTTDAVDYST